MRCVDTEENTGGGKRLTGQILTLRHEKLKSVKRGLDNFVVPAVNVAYLWVNYPLSVPELILLSTPPGSTVIARLNPRLPQPGPPCCQLSTPGTLRDLPVLNWKR